MRVYAHRGVSAHYPENKEPADLGVDALSTDDPLLIRNALPASLLTSPLGR